MQWGFNAWQSRPLLRQGQHIGEARVQLGGATSVGLVAPRNIAVTYPAGLADLRARIVYKGPVDGADRAGPAYRRPRRHHRRHAAADVPLVAGEDVGEAGFFGRIWPG